MFGSDAIAGVINLIPAIPSNFNKKISGKIFSEYQSNNSLIGNGLRLSYGSGHWSFALRGSYRIAKNYQNSVDGRVFNSGFREANISGLADYRSDKGSSNVNVTLYDNLQGIPDGSRDSLTRKFTKQVYEIPLDDIKNRPVVTDAELTSYKLNPLHQHIRHYRIYSNNHYKLGRGDIDALLALQQNIRAEFNHPTNPEQAGMLVRLHTINYGFRYNAPSIYNIDFSAGVNGMQQNNRNKNATDFPIPNYNLLDVGGYVYAKWKHKNWTVSGGARYDIRYLSGMDFFTRKDPVTRYDKRVELPDTAGAYLQFPSFKKKFNGFSFSIGSTYQVNNQISIKANIARGYRAPNITEFASNGLDPGAHIVYLGNRSFVPEFNMQEDIGISGTFRDLSFLVSMFNNNIQHYIYLSQLTDVQGNPVIIVPGNKTYQYLQSRAQLYGMEGSLEFHPKNMKGFSFNNSFSMTYGRNTSTAFRDKGTNGEYLPLIPPVKLLSTASQNIETRGKVFRAFNFKAEIDFNAAQNNYLALDNSETATPSYTLVHLAGGTEISHSKNSSIQVQLQINNLFDKSYQSNLSRLKYFEYYSQSPTGNFGIYGMGRNICLKLIIGFE